MQHHAATSNDYPAMVRCAGLPPDEAGRVVFWAAFAPSIPTWRKIKSHSIVGGRPSIKLYAQHLAEIQHDQAIAVTSLPVTAPAHPRDTDGASNEFGLCKASWHPSDAREPWLDQLQTRECCRVIDHPDLTPHRVVICCHHLHRIRRELHPASLGSVEAPRHLRRRRVA